MGNSRHRNQVGRRTLRGDKMYRCGVCGEVIEAGKQMHRITEYRETIDKDTHLPREEVAREIPVCERCDFNHKSKQ